MLWLKRFWPLLVGLLYLGSPVDAIPDALIGLGWSDDLLILLLAYWLCKRMGRAKYGRLGGGDSGTPGDDGRRRPSQEEQAKEDPYEILGVSPGATREEIKSAYRQQAQRYHPDRVSHLGEEFQHLAKKRFQEIQRAYETLSGRAR